MKYLKKAIFIIAIINLILLFICFFHMTSKIVFITPTNIRFIKDSLSNTIKYSSDIILISLGGFRSRDIYVYHLFGKIEHFYTFDLSINESNTLLEFINKNSINPQYWQIYSPILSLIYIKLYKSNKLNNFVNVILYIMIFLSIFMACIFSILLF